MGLGGELTGGRDIGKDLPVPMGIAGLAEPHARRGRSRDWSDGQLFRAIRNGVDAEGRWLMIMSYTNAGKLSDEDTKSVIAYLRSLAPAGAPTQVPADQLNPMGAAMLGAGMLPRGNPVSEGRRSSHRCAGPTVAWGQYLLSYQDCNACHGADLARRRAGPARTDRPRPRDGLGLVAAGLHHARCAPASTPTTIRSRSRCPGASSARWTTRISRRMFQALTHLPAGTATTRNRKRRREGRLPPHTSHAVSPDPKLPASTPGRGPGAPPSPGRAGAAFALGRGA